MTQHQLNELYEKILQQKSLDNAFMSLVGVRLSAISEGYAKAELDITPAHLNPYGAVHGGCIYTLADIVAGAAVISHGFDSVTVSSSFNFLNGADGATKKLFAEAQEVKHGRTISVTDVKITSDTGTLVATGAFTYFMFDTRTYCEKL